MKYALVKFRVHLLGSEPFVIFTDHASLRTATKSPHLSQRMARWLSFFAEYNFEVKYKPGKQNALADALSRRPDYELFHVTTISSPIPSLIRSTYAADAQCVVFRAPRRSFHCRHVCVRNCIVFRSVMTCCSTAPMLLIIRVSLFFTMRI